MAMPSNRYCFFAVLSICVALTLPAKAQDVAAPYQIDPFPPSDEGFADVFQHMDAAHCATPDCLALDKIGRSFKVFIESGTTAMGLGGPTPENRTYAAKQTQPARINRLLRQVLLDRPDLFPAMCARIADLAARYDNSDPGKSEYTYMNFTLEMALLIDRKKTSDCLPTALAALPRTPDNDELVEGARGFCENSQWHGRDCALIARQKSHGNAK